MFKKILKKIFNAPEPPTSDIDQFLRHFDEKHPQRSASQLKAITKAQKIAQSMRASKKP